MKTLYVLLAATAGVNGSCGMAAADRGAERPDLEQDWTRGPGDYDFELIHDGLQRTYKVHVPPGYRSTTPAAVVLAFHGGGGSSEGSVRYFELLAKSDAEGFIVVYPQGTGPLFFGSIFGSWNAGKCCAPAMDEGVDDLGYVSALLDHIEGDFRIDAQRVFATGMSNGAMMSYRLACDLSERIAAIAVSGAVDGVLECNPTRAVPIMHIHGRLDPCGLYEGGKCGGCMAEFLEEVLGIPVERRGWDCGPVEDYLAEWATRNGCTEYGTTIENEALTFMEWSGCDDGADVTLCAVADMGHTWGGQTTHGLEACFRNPDSYICRLYASIVGPLSDAIMANDAMWEFFEEHPMGAAGGE